MDDLYQWFLEKVGNNKTLRQRYREELESYERWILEERKIKEAKAAFHFCSGYIVNHEGRKVRAMCRMHKVTKAQTSLKILEDGYWVSDDNLKAEDMVVERQDLTYLDNTEAEIKTDKPNPIIDSQYRTRKAIPRYSLEKEEQAELDMLDRLSERLKKNKENN